MTTPSATAEEALVRSLEAIARAMRESSFDLARDVPCSRGAVPVLRLLDIRGPLQVGEIADLMHVDISVASRQVGNLVDEGLAERIEAEHDRRVRTLRLTRRGEDLAADLRAEVVRRSAEVFVDWTAPELEAAVATLDHIARSIEAQTRSSRAAPPKPAHQKPASHEPAPQKKDA